MKHTLPISNLIALLMAGFLPACALESNEFAAADDAATAQESLESTSGLGRSIVGVVGLDFSVSAAAQQQLLSGIRVEVVGTSISALTAADGRFALRGVPVRDTPYVLRFSRVSFLTRNVENVYVRESTDTIVGTAATPIALWAGDLPSNGAQDDAINSGDLMRLAAANNSVSGDPAYQANLDLNVDGNINMADVMILAKHYGTSTASYPVASVSYKDVSNDPMAVGLYRLVSKATRSTLTQTTSLGWSKYTGLPNQEWRFERKPNNAYALVLSSNEQCLYNGSPGVGFGTCGDDAGRWTLETIRARTVDKPAVYRVHPVNASSECLLPTATGPRQGACGETANWYIEPVNYGERRASFMAELRPLLIVKPSTRVNSPSISADIPADVRQEAKISFTQHVPVWFQKMTDGAIRWVAQAVDSPRGLTSVSIVQDAPNPIQYWPAPLDMTADLDQFMPARTYDSILTLWAGRGNDGWGWGGTHRDARGATWSTINYTGWPYPAAAWTSWAHEPTEVFIHEFLEGMNAFYYPRGVPLPPEGLHGSDNCQYDRLNIADGYMHWYRDFLLGTVIGPNDSYVGLGPRAFNQGTPRTIAQ